MDGFLILILLLVAIGLTVNRFLGAKNSEEEQLVEEVVLQDLEIITSDLDFLCVTYTVDEDGHKVLIENMRELDHRDVDIFVSNIEEMVDYVKLRYGVKVEVEYVE